MQHHCPSARFILVGTKSDLKEDMQVIGALERMGETPVSRDEGEKLRREIKAWAYIGKV